MTPGIQHIELTITRMRVDGSTYEIRAAIMPTYGYQQWGATTADLWPNVAALAAMEEAIRDQWADDDDTEDETL